MDMAPIDTLTVIADAAIPGLVPARPDLARLETIVSACEKRVRRAGAKLAAAQAEQEAALMALDEARQARATWIADNDEPQMTLI